MTETFPDQYSRDRVFIVSALGSLLLHGAFVAGLAYLPNSPTVKEEAPTVQVTLLPTPQAPQTPTTPASPIQPRAAMQKTSSPPPPSARPVRPQPPAPPVQASLTPPAVGKPSRLSPPISAQPILKDRRASQAMKARDMMKMRVHTQSRHTSSSLPTIRTQQNGAMRGLPPAPMVTRQQRSTTSSLPALPMLTKPQTLARTPHSPTGSSITRPAILSSSKPAYPRVARESGWKGTVIVRTLIDTSGVPSQVTLRKSSGHPTLDQAAQDAVKTWKFHPAKDGNIPITKWVDIPIKFDLNS